VKRYRKEIQKRDLNLLLGILEDILNILLTLHDTVDSFVRFKKQLRIKKPFGPNYSLESLSHFGLRVSSLGLRIETSWHSGL